MMSLTKTLVDFLTVHIPTTMSFKYDMPTSFDNTYLHRTLKLHLGGESYSP